METQKIYEVIAKVHTNPAMCFEFWILSSAGIIPEAKMAQENLPLEPSS